MAHRAERIRKRKIRELEYGRSEAEAYSAKVNAHIDSILRTAFALRYPDNMLEYIDATDLYDVWQRMYRNGIYTTLDPSQTN